MTAQILTSMRELDSRVIDGIHVRLLWSESEGGVSVAVTDTKTGEAFSLAVRDNERALDVFHHPYAYAARHGVTLQMPARAADADVSLAA